MPNDVGLLILIGVGIILVILRRLFGRSVEPLQFKELDSIFTKNDEIEIVDRNTTRHIPGADTRIQLRTENASIIYNVTYRKDNKVAETMDIWVAGHTGMILTFVDKNLKVFERVGGFPVEGNLLREFVSKEDEECAAHLLERIRHKVMTD